MKIDIRIYSNDFMNFQTNKKKPICEKMNVLIKAIFIYNNSKILYVYTSNIREH